MLGQSSVFELYVSLKIIHSEVCYFHCFSSGSAWLLQGKGVCELLGISSVLEEARICAILEVGIYMPTTPYSTSETQFPLQISTLSPLSGFITIRTFPERTG